MIRLIPLLLLCACSAATETPSSDTSIQSIYWSDGDSGRIDGVKFRLSNVDAPETGGVGGRGGAKCESERELGYASKEFIVELTRNADVQIAAEYDLDQYDRLVVDLTVDGSDLGELGIASGHLEPWPHRGRRALQPKPDWC